MLKGGYICQTKEALIGRFGEHDEKVHPGSRSYDGSYTELKLMDSDHELMVQSAEMGGRQYIGGVRALHAAPPTSHPCKQLLPHGFLLPHVKRCCSLEGLFEGYKN